MALLLRTLFLVGFIGIVFLPIGAAIGRSWLLSIPPVAALAYFAYLVLHHPQSVTAILLVALVLFAFVADAWMSAGIALRHRNTR